MDFSKIPIGEFAALPVFQGYEYLIAEENPELAPMVDAMNISQVCRYFEEPVWDEQSLTDGIRYLYDRACSGRVLYSLPAEGRQIPPAEKTGLAAFPVLQNPDNVIK